MIITLQNSASADRAASAAGLIGTFVKVDVLKMTSVELRQAYGISFAPIDAENTFELMKMLARDGSRKTGVALRKDRLARLLDRHQHLLPCFVAYQQVPEVGLLPIVSDVVPGKWSLFFEPDGEMSLFEAQSDCLWIRREEDLLGRMPESAKDRSPGPVAARLGAIGTAVAARLPRLKMKG